LSPSRRSSSEQRKCLGRVGCSDIWGYLKKAPDKDINEDLGVNSLLKKPSDALLFMMNLLSTNIILSLII
jgi:hypothetical protein